MADKFELLAFYSNPKLLEELIEAGIDGIIVDWENQGKEYRQSLYNTQVNQHKTNDLAVVKNKNPSTIICRINGPDYWSTNEINQAIDMGADELLLPMIRTPEEAKFVINHVNGQVEVGLMLETNEALEIADVLNDLPVNRFYVGLNDLSIQRRTRKLFLPFVDGTIDKLRPMIDKKFGIAGLTHPLAGEPIPCCHLINQMKYHRCSFSFLRRSFYRDLSKYSVSEILQALRREFQGNSKREIQELTHLEKELFNQELI